MCHVLGIVWGIILGHWGNVGTWHRGGMRFDRQKDGEEKREFDLDDAFASSLLSEGIRDGAPV